MRNYETKKNKSNNDANLYDDKYILKEVFHDFLKKVVDCYQGTVTVSKGFFSNDVSSNGTKKYSLVRVFSLLSTVIRRNPGS